MPQNIWKGTNGAPVLTQNIDTDRVDIDVSQTILDVMPDETPFFVVSSRVGVETTKTKEFSWFDDDLESYYTKVLVACDSLTDTLSVADTSIIKRKDVILNTRTGEIMLVKNIVNGNQIEVKRQATREEVGGQNLGGTAAAPMLLDDNIMILSNALEENAMPADPTGTQPGKYWNYVQSFSDTISGSDDSEEEKKTVGGSERQRQRRKMAKRHKMRIERALVFGERRYDTTEKRMYTGGLLYFLNDNHYHMTGEFTEAEFEKYCECAFAYGNKTKLMLCSQALGSAINQIAAGKIQTVSGDKSYGLQLSTYQSFHGKLVIATTKMFDRDFGGTGVTLDLENIKIRKFGSNSATLRANIQEIGLHGWKDEMYSQLGLMVRLTKTHSRLDVDKFRG